MHQNLASHARRIRPEKHLARSILMDLQDGYEEQNSLINVLNGGEKLGIFKQ